MSVGKVIANTLRIARRDLDDSRLLASHQSRNAAYLCEQAAEKVIRAILTSKNVRGGVGHQLEEMVDLIPDENPLKPTLRAIQGLTIYATTYRYVTSVGRIPTPPEEDQFEEFAQKVEAALVAAVDRFGVDLSQKESPAKNPTPIR